MVRKQGDEIAGSNRRGLVIALPEPIRQAVNAPYTPGRPNTGGPQLKYKQAERTT
jgi:hypothetical protein